MLLGKNYYCCILVKYLISMFLKGPTVSLFQLIQFSDYINSDSNDLKSPQSMEQFSKSISAKTHKGDQIIKSEKRWCPICQPPYQTLRTAISFAH